MQVIILYAPLFTFTPYSGYQDRHKRLLIYGISDCNIHYSPPQQAGYLGKNKTKQNYYYHIHLTLNM